MNWRNKAILYIPAIIGSLTCLFLIISGVKLITYDIAFFPAYLAFTFIGAFCFVKGIDISIEWKNNLQGDGE